MTELRVNLVGGKVLPPGARHRLYRSLIGYLALCGMILTVVCYRATGAIVRSLWQRADIARLESNFRREHPGQPPMLEYARQLEIRAGAAVATLGGIETALTERHDLARIVARLSVPLPADVQMTTFEMLREKGTILFDLAAPLGRQGEESLDTGKLVAAWKEDAQLMRYIRDVKSVASKRMGAGGESRLVVKFAVLLNKEGG